MAWDIMHSTNKEAIPLWTNTGLPREEIVVIDISLILIVNLQTTNRWRRWNIFELLELRLASSQWL